MGERVWERFLTEQDKAHLAAIGPPVHRGFGESAAVLSIDNYLMAVGDAPLPLLESVKTWPGSTGIAGWEALAQIACLFEAARSNGIPVIHVNLFDDYSDLLASKPKANRYEPPVGGELFARRHEFMTQAAPLPGELVIRKTSPSAFFNTPLARFLFKRGIDTLIVCGESVSGCVRASVVDGDSHGFRMIVAEECVYDRHEASLAINLFDIDQKYGEVVALADITTHLHKFARDDRHR